MARRKHAIQFLHIASSARGADAGLLIEQLRHAGIVSVVSEKAVGEDRVAYMLQIRCPHGLNDVSWAARNAERMRSFGINATDILVD